MGSMLPYIAAPWILWDLEDHIPMVRAEIMGDSYSDVPSSGSAGSGSAAKIAGNSEEFVVSLN